MNNALNGKPMIDECVVKQNVRVPLDHVLAQLEAEYDLEEQHESWWSVLLFWIRELRWHRAFWKKVKRLHERERR